jgi:hypothetical protein
MGEQMNSNYIYFCYFTFSIFLYLIVTDNSVASFVTYTSKIISFYFKKHIWWILNNPKNPIVKYIIWRRSIKMAEEIMKEYQNK